MRNYSLDPQVNKRFETLEKKLKHTLDALPDVNEIHDAANPGTTMVVGYGLQAYAFFEEYKKDLDAERCLKTLDISKTTYNKWLSQPKFTDVINRIHEAYADAVLMDGKTIAGWSVEILRDLHNAFKNGDSKTSGALATMAGNMLRASGNFKDSQAAVPQVLIQINTGQAQPITDQQSTTTAPPQELPVINISTNQTTKQNDKSSIANLSILR